MVLVYKGEKHENNKKSEKKNNKSIYRYLSLQRIMKKP